MSDRPQLILLTADESEFVNAGLPFRKQNQWRWLYRRRNQNGFAKAFVDIGNRVAIDVPKFHEIARSKSEAASAA